MTTKQRILKLENDTKNTGEKIIVVDYLNRPTVTVGGVEMPRAEFDALIAGPDAGKYDIIQVEYIETPIPKND